MITTRVKPLAAASLLLLVLGGAASAQTSDTLRVDAARGSRVWIEGSSNVANWRCQAASFEARVEVMSPGPGEATPRLRAIDVRVVVRDLKCGNRKMEHDLYAALGAGDPAKPAFIYGRFEVQPDSSVGATIPTRGNLTVAGVERAVSVPVSADRVADGVMRARGSISLLMTDFGVKPPVGLLGLIRSRNEVTVRFDLLVYPRVIALSGR